MAALQSFDFCLHCQKSHKLIKQLMKYNFQIDVLSCRQFYTTEKAFINKTKFIFQNDHMTQQQCFLQCYVHSGCINCSPYELKS